MAAEGNPNAWARENNPFGEDFFLLPHEEEIRSRVEQVAEDNRDALRHHVEMLVWEVLGHPDLLKIVVSLYWLWEEVEPRWIAEASFMSVGDVRDLAEAQPVMTFNCLDCGAHLQPRSRQRLLRMHGSLRAFRRDGVDEERLADLLCAACSKQRTDHAQDQRRLDNLRQQAILAEYRGRPYAERRLTREWAMLKRQVHRRDRYRCRLCGSAGEQLHVHHCTYANYAEEKLEDLITLCGECHRRFHYLEAS